VATSPEQDDRWTTLARNITVVWQAVRAPALFLIGTVIILWQILGYETYGRVPDPTACALVAAMYAVGGFLTGSKG
jgi:hypothetical protein